MTRRGKGHFGKSLMGNTFCRNVTSSPSVLAFSANSCYKSLAPEGITRPRRPALLERTKTGPSAAVLAAAGHRVTEKPKNQVGPKWEKSGKLVDEIDKSKLFRQDNEVKNFFSSVEPGVVILWSMRAWFSSRLRTAPPASKTPASKHKKS
jgi:hypothetical protein